MIKRCHSFPVLVLLPIVLLGGCGSTPTTGGGLAGALADYEKGDYRSAHDKAIEASQRSTGVERDKAMYVAGVSAFRKFDYVEAEARCSLAAGSSDAETAGRAKATLGLVCLSQSRPAVAAQHLSAASRQLQGAEASEAAYRAGLAYQLAGDETAARRSFEQARAGGASMGGSPASPSAGGASPRSPTLISGLFAIQVGAFQDMENAQSAAGDARTLADRHALGEVRIVPKRDTRGRTLYVVQVGQFGTRSAAESALRRTGQNRYIVAPLSS